jgi:oligoribonuclease (3'-5' exoribonuclease)
MKKMLLGLMLALSVTGCGLVDQLIDTTPLPVSDSLPPLAKQAQIAVNEANGFLASMAIVVNQDAKAGLITRAKEAEHKAQFRGYAKDLDAAQKAIDKCVDLGVECNIVPDKERIAKFIKSGLQELREALAKRRGR